MAKRALLIGCNYPGTKAELHGCVNDVSRMYKSLVDRFGFSEDDITVMVDTDRRSVQPTGANIKKVLGRLIGESVPGDFLVMHYSGHGTQVPAETGDDEDDGLDEAIVPTDLNLLTDDDFRLLFKNIEHGVQFTFISDSCHSGGLIDHEKEQIGSEPGAPARSYAPQSQSRSYGGGYERDSSEYESRGERQGHREYERREEPSEYEREERHGHHKGRREEPEYEREEGYGRHHGRREESRYEEEPRSEKYGHQQRPGYEGGYQQGGGYEQGGGYGGGYQQGGGYEQGGGYGGGYQQGGGYEQGGGYGGGHQQGGGYEQGGGYGGGYKRQVPFNNKSLSIETLTEMLSQQAGHEVKPGNIRTSLYDMFGEDASPTVKVFVNLISSRLSGQSGGAQEGGIWGTIGGLAMDFMKAKLNDSNSSFTPPASVTSSAVSQSGYAGRRPALSERVSDDVGILVSGCQSNETSADANPTGNPAEAYGALSNGIQTILKERNGPITNGELVTAVRALLQKQGFSQHPCLYSSDRNVNATFICE